MPELDQVFEWDVGGLDRPDIDTVNRACKMALESKRLGCGFRLANAPRELSDLMELCGLTEVVRCTPGSGGETVR